jgi:hypothetical protein
MSGFENGLDIEVISNTSEFLRYSSDMGDNYPAVGHFV